MHSDTTQWHRLRIDADGRASIHDWFEFKRRFGEVYREAGLPVGVMLYRENAETYLLTPAASDLCLRTTALRDFWKFLAPVSKTAAARPRNAVIV